LIAANVVAQYVYNALNQRVRATVGGAATEYVFNAAGQRVSEWNGTTRAQLKGKYYWGAKAVAYYANGATYFEHQDWLGTERMRTTYNGGVEGSYQSLPFGDGQATTGANTDANHYATLDHDAETATDHAQFRQYSNAQGLWLSPDPYSGSYDASNPQSMNRYVYAMNNPLAAVDPSGLQVGRNLCLNSQVCLNQITLSIQEIGGGDGSTIATSGEQSTIILYDSDGSVISISDDTSATFTYEPNPNIWPSGWVLIAVSNDPATANGAGGGGGGGGNSYGTSAPNNGTSKQQQCAGAALKKNAVSLSLDVAGVGAGFLPGGDLVVAGAKMGVNAASTVNSAVHGDTTGAMTSIFGFQVSAMVPAAKLVGVGAKAVPILGAVISTVGAANDAWNTYKDYQSCMAGHS
jgi:RHS repeat-associated protein